MPQENPTLDTAEKWLDSGIAFVTDYGPKVIGALLIFLIGNYVIGRLVKAMRKVLAKGDYDPSLQGFLMNLVSWSLKVLLILVVVARLGVNVTTFAAVIASAGLAVGLALQGSLANFAGGVLIMIFKPYRVGDLIEAQGVLGNVKEIEIFTTQLITPENKRVIVPNGPMANGNITNYTAEGKIRVDTVVGIGYGEDLKKAKETLLKVLTDNPQVLADPAPAVTVLGLGDSSVDLAVRPFCKPEDYWDVYFATYEGCKLALDEAGIEIPYPHQVEIHKQA